MKILKICGVVAGIHALVILVIFINPGCSSTTKADGAPSDTSPAPVPVPAATTTPAAATETSSSPAIVPVPAGNAFYAPTRPNTAAAVALEPAAPVPDVTPAATYVVKSGDSLWLIAHRNHLKVAELAAANSLKATATLHAGQKLLIPTKAAAAPAATSAEMPPAANATAMAAAPAGGAPAKPASTETKYTVKSGEALSTIAKRFGLTTGDLAARNNITDPRKIRPGQELIIPAGHTPKAGKKGRKGSAPAATNTAPSASAPSASAAPAPAAADAGAPGPETTPTVSIPIIKIDGADSSAPSAATPAK